MPNFWQSGGFFEMLVAVPCPSRLGGLTMADLADLVADIADRMARATLRGRVADYIP